MLVTTHIFSSHDIISLELKMHSRVLKIELYSQLRIYPTAIVLVLLFNAENSACWFTIALHHQFLLGFKLQGPCKTKHWLSHWGWIHSFSFFEIKLTTSVPPVKPALLLIEIFPKIELSFYLHHSRHILHLHQSSYGQTILPQISKSSAPNTLSHESCNSLFCLQRRLQPSVFAIFIYHKELFPSYDGRKRCILLRITYKWTIWFILSMITIRCTY